MPHVFAKETVFCIAHLKKFLKSYFAETLLLKDAKCSLIDFRVSDPSSSNSVSISRSTSSEILCNTAPLVPLKREANKEDGEEEEEFCLRERRREREG